jgi:predicted membrane protein
MYKIIKILILIIILTLVFFYLPNKSNFPKKYIIPIIVALIIKYSLGDLDKGYIYTISDIFYWFIILFIPYLIICYLERKV